MTLRGRSSVRRSDGDEVGMFGGCRRQTHQYERLRARPSVQVHCSAAMGEREEDS